MNGKPKKPRLLPGITHIVIITAKDQATAKKLDRWATLQLCFGPDDNNAIYGVHYVKPAIRLPHITVQIDGKEKIMPVFKGAVGQEIAQLSYAALALLKEQVGFKYNRKYRVTDNKAFDITPPEAQPEKANIEEKEG